MGLCCVAKMFLPIYGASSQNSNLDVIEQFLCVCVCVRVCLQKYALLFKQIIRIHTDQIDQERSHLLSPPNVTIRRVPQIVY